MNARAALAGESFPRQGHLLTDLPFALSGLTGGKSARYVFLTENPALAGKAAEYDDTRGCSPSWLPSSNSFLHFIPCPNG